MRKIVGFDLETDGLDPYAGAKAFIIGIADCDGSTRAVRLSPDSYRWLTEFFSHEDVVYCAHNAKFELSFLREQFGVEVAGTVWDTEVMARIEFNNHPSYSLQNCAQRVGLSKYGPMLEWLKLKGNKAAYHRAPEELIVPYVKQDAWLSWKLCHLQIETFKHWDTTPQPIKPVVELECRVLRPLFEMESNGLLIDTEYCEKARDYEKEKAQKAAEEFSRLTGVPFVDSRKTLGPVCDHAGIPYAKTDKGNPSFTEEALKASWGHPIIRAVLDHRAATKRLSTYWENFLEIAQAGVIHSQINQNRADTGRMSISRPSLQNVPTDEDDPVFPVRRAFVARAGCVIASLDYSQMELRKISDEAGDRTMIDKILSGADLHQEVADMAGVPRSLAKNGRFARQYGGGVPRVAATLGVDLSTAQRVCDAIAEQTRVSSEYSWGLISYAKRSPYSFDWLGRRFYFDPGFEYKAPNYRIQGGCGEILKRAIIDVGAYLKEAASCNTYMLIPIHDEILLNVHERDLKLLPRIKEIMIAAHTDKKYLPMDVAVHTGPNMYDLEKIL